MPASSPPIDTSGAGTPLTENGIAAAAARAGVGVPELWAVVTVETAGCGFLPDHRPKILFERHVFCRLTDGRFDTAAPDISQPNPGGYGATGAHQNDRLAVATKLDAVAALQSASWGLGQVLGENFAAAGFADVHTMAAAMAASEDAQLLAMAAFMAETQMAAALHAHDWSDFACRYNGPDYAAHHYDIDLARAYAQYAAGPLPDLRVRAAQVYLTYRGFSPGDVDGVAGPRTNLAVRAFQAVEGLAQSGVVDEALVVLLRTPLPSAVGGHAQQDDAGEERRA